MKIAAMYFGKTSSGIEVTKYTLINSNGMAVSIIDLGATITSIIVPDKNGLMSDVVAGYDSARSYELANGYLGACIGRFGNRIAKGEFSLDGTTYSGLFLNNNGNHLHGGKCGFSHKMWNVTANEETNSLECKYVSSDGEEGYPGELSVTITFTLNDNNELSINYKATANKKTVINLTNHSYFNLNGFASGTVLDHTVWMDADRYLPTDADLIPTGEIRNVSGTTFDFRTTKTIGKDFAPDNDNDQKLAGGYDHCMVFTNNETNAMQKRIRLSSEQSGRYMEVITDRPCVQFYTANFLNNAEFPLKGGYPQRTQTAVCLETQCMPDSMNHAGFTDCTLDVGQVYDTTTTFRFGIQ